MAINLPHDPIPLGFTVGAASASNALRSGGSLNPVTTFRDRLRPASFRGVPFFVEGEEVEDGRRVIDHELVNVDLPLAEDLGRDAQVFNVEGYFVGDDVHELRDRMIAAAREEGPGALVHPTLGEVRVICKRLRSSTRRLEGAFVSFTLTLREAGPTVRSTASIDPQSAVETAATAAAVSANEAFAAAVVVKNLPAFVRTPVTQEWGRLRDLVNRLGLAGAAELARKVRTKLEDIADELITRLENPSPLATDIENLFDELGAASGSRLSAIELYLGIARSRALPRSGAGPLSATERDNGEAFVRVLRVHAVRGAARTAADVDWPTLQDALDARQSILDELDALEGEVDEMTFVALADLRSTIVDAVPPPDASLPELDIYQPAQVEPALVAAYRLYDDARREAEIVSRNRVPYPGFLPAGVDLEVLSV